MVWKINFSQVAKISCRLVLKWPRYKKKPQKWTLKTIFLKNPPGFWTFEKSSSKLKRANLAETDMSGHEIYPKGPSWPMCHVNDICKIMQEVTLPLIDTGNMNGFLTIIHWWLFLFLMSRHLQLKDYCCITPSDDTGCFVTGPTKKFKALRSILRLG